jgi:ketosteroid isomerase-like protein
MAALAADLGVRRTLLSDVRLARKKAIAAEVRMRTLSVVAVATCTWCLSTASAAQTAQGLSDADVGKISATAETFAKAVLSKEWATVAALFSDDAVLNPPNQPAVRGRPAIRTWMEGFPPVTHVKFTILKVEGRGDLAYVLGSYTETFAPPDTQPIKDSGKYLEIRRRQSDGKWPIAVAMFNSDLPPPTGPSK